MSLVHSKANHALLVHISVKHFSPSQYSQHRFMAHENQTVLSTLNSILHFFIFLFLSHKGYFQTSFAELLGLVLHNRTKRADSYSNAVVSILLSSRPPQTVKNVRKGSITERLAAPSWWHHKNIASQHETSDSLCLFLSRAVIP